MVYNNCYLWSLCCAKPDCSLFLASCDLGSIDIVSLPPFGNHLSDLLCDQLSVLHAPCTDSNLQKHHLLKLVIIERHILHV